ncbi:MAG: protease modulator HflC [Verrucomicrobia bacterium]|nr:protease modulator HflC [Verrucomicrobiota bacterium]
MKKNPITLITGAVLVVLFLFMLFSYQVRETQVAVVTTFGRFSRSITEPGFRFRLPWPVEKVYEFDKRLQNFESKYDQTITRDQIAIVAQVYVGWRISDPRIFLERFNGDLQEAQRTLEPVMRNAKSEVLGTHAFSDLVSTNTGALKFDQIEQEMLGRIQRQAEELYGMKIELVGIKRLGLPESITTSVFERMRAERQRLVAMYQTEGEREAKIIRANADGQANEILAEARAEAIRVTGEAELKAQEYYAVFEQKPELAIFLLQLKALEEALKERSHLILDAQTSPLNLLSGAAQPQP